MPTRSGMPVRRVLRDPDDPVLRMTADEVWTRLRADDPDLDQKLAEVGRDMRAGKAVSLKELRSRG